MSTRRRTPRDILASLRNERGDINVIVFAVSLPLLVLIGTAAMDIARFPIAKQQALAAIQTGFDDLKLQTGDNASLAETAVGRDWCAIFPSNHPRNTCTPCAEEESATCSGAKDAAAGDAVDLAAASILRELTDSGFGVLSHAKGDVTIKVSIYNLIVPDDGNTDSLIIGKELVASDTAGELPGVNIDHDALVEETFVTPGDVSLGAYLTWMPDSEQLATDVSIAVLSVVLRVHHVFSLPDELRFGEGPGFDEDADGITGDDSSVFITTIIRPLNRGVRLSGPAGPLMES